MMSTCWRMPPQKAFDATFDVDDSLVNEDESELPGAAVGVLHTEQRLLNALAALRCPGTTL